MTGVVLGGSPLQNTDYWLMLPRFTSPDGGLDVVGLFHFENEHPVVIPQFIYWLNLRLFAGSNITLGFVVIALVLGQLAVIALDVAPEPIPSVRTDRDLRPGEPRCSSTSPARGTSTRR